MTDQDRIKLIEETQLQLVGIREKLHDIVWEAQEGQPDHFDNLQKVEKVALIGLYNDSCQFCSSLDSYLHWFKKK